MSHRELITALKSLPPEAREQVAELIVFLRKKHDLAKQPAKTNGPGASRHEFIGMWRDRDDLKDSSAWVRKTRRREWSDA
jgi:hypothetical protein